MPRLSVDDAGHLVSAVLPDPFPDAHHIATGGVYDGAPYFLDRFPCVDLCSKGGDNDDVFRCKLGEFSIGRATLKRLNAHALELIIHLWIVDNLTE